MAFRLANIDGRAALIDGANYFDLEHSSGGELGSDPMAALESLDILSALTEKLPQAMPTGRLQDVCLGPPVPRPANCYAVGLNYRGHAEESGMKIPQVPMVFTKFPACLAGPTADVIMRSDYVDFEAELVVVVGRGGKDIAPENGWNHVAGLCVGQDMSDRCVQFSSSPPQFNLGKSFDSFGPIGPVLTSPDALDNRDSLALSCVINGDMRQQDNTDDLIFNVPTLIAYLSEICTLQTGDVIFTGTPAGVGVVEARFLGDGDVIETTIEGLGTLRNRCVRGADHSRAQVIPESLAAMVPGLAPGT